MELRDHIQGCILGTAVGDAIGLPREGVSRHRAQGMFGDLPIEHCFFHGRGMCSDDTEHTIMVAQAWLTSGGDVRKFRTSLGWRLRWWFLRFPAGTGFATLRACLKLWFGIHPSGVRSAGNGPAMRSALLGILARDETEMIEFVRTATRITHTDSRAEQGALIIARSARAIVHQRNDELRDSLLRQVDEPELRSNMLAVFDALEREQTPIQFAEMLGLSNGISGFINHTVPVAVFCWLANRGDYQATVESAVALGGDTDTVAAIAGALAGTELSPDEIPQPWLENLVEWPCTVSWMSDLGAALANSLQSQDASVNVRANGLLVFARNLVFAVIVLLHGFRRLLPPY